MEYAYQNRVAVFVDILGFRAFIDSTAHAGGGDRARIQMIYDAIDWTRSALVDDLKSFEADPALSQFSDSFVMSILIGQPEATARFLMTSSIAIETLMHCGFLCRGGITVGALFHQNGIVFGPAMIRAHELESKLAIYPRVIVDPSAELSLSGLDNISWFRALLTRDTDGYMFVNYFDRSRSIQSRVPGEFLRLQRLIEAIPESNPCLKLKKSWAASQYNAAISKFSFRKYRAELQRKIDAGDPDHKDNVETLRQASEIHPIGPPA